MCTQNQDIFDIMRVPIKQHCRNNNEDKNNQEQSEKESKEILDQILTKKRVSDDLSYGCNFGAP